MERFVNFELIIAQTCLLPTMISVLALVLLSLRVRMYGGGF